MGDLNHAADAELLNNIELHMKEGNIVESSQKRNLRAVNNPEVSESIFSSWMQKLLDVSCTIEEPCDDLAERACIDRDNCKWSEKKDKCFEPRECEDIKKEDNCDKRDNCKWSKKQEKCFEPRECEDIEKEDNCDKRDHCKWKADGCFVK